MDALDPSGLWGETDGAMEIADFWLDARELVDIVDGLQGACYWALGESFNVI